MQKTHRVTLICRLPSPWKFFTNWVARKSKSHPKLYRNRKRVVIKTASFDSTKNTVWMAKPNTKCAWCCMCNIFFSLLAVRRCTKGGQRSENKTEDNSFSYFISASHCLCSGRGYNVSGMTHFLKVGGKGSYLQKEAPCPNPCVPLELS